ncbi:MAG: hypothetical protein EOO61_02250 [Hymenobacter sp.]|nr:MAG: hypothetical protein EOO61_02250 [Hymenobacter sp.]
MNTLVIDRTQQHEKLLALQATLQQVIKDDKQASIDRFLDKINDAKQAIQESLEASQPLAQALREIAWFTNVAPESLKLIKQLIDRLEAHSYTMVKLYADYSRTFAQLKLNRVVLRKYKEAADDLKEACIDVRHRFFDLPQDDEFMDLMQQLDEVA